MRSRLILLFFVGRYFVAFGFRPGPKPRSGDRSVGHRHTWQTKRMDHGTSTLPSREKASPRPWNCDCRSGSFGRKRNRYRLEAIKSLLPVQVQYDATVGKKNNASVSQYNVDMARYNLLRNQSDGLRMRQANLASQLAGAQSQLAVLPADNPQNPKRIADQNAEITRITQDQAAVNAEASSLNQALAAC